MADTGFSKPGPLSFDANVGEDWRKLEQVYNVSIAAAHSDKDEKTQAYIFLTDLAGSEAIKKGPSHTHRVRNEMIQNVSKINSLKSVIPKRMSHWNATNLIRECKKQVSHFKPPYLTWETRQARVNSVL